MRNFDADVEETKYMSNGNTPGGGRKLDLREILGIVAFVISCLLWALTDCCCLCGICCFLLGIPTAIFGIGLAVLFPSFLSVPSFWVFSLVVLALFFLTIFLLSKSEKQFARIMGLVAKIAMICQGSMCGIQLLCLCCCGCLVVLTFIVVLIVGVIGALANKK